MADSELSGEEEIYRGSVLDHPLYMYRIVGANLGDFSPTQTVHATDAAQIVDHLRAPGFDGRELAIVEEELPETLVAAGNVKVSLHKGPRIHVEAQSAGTSLLVLPFEFSHCLQVRGTGLDRIIPVNLAQTGLVIRAELRTFKGVQLADLRVMALANTVELPTKSGFSIRIEQLPELADLVAKALAEARARGLLAG